jgi:Ca-activated chloride channel family protein
MSTPRINPNDPKWTAYVLGDLDAAERDAAGRLLDASPEARALVDELRAATGAIEEALASEPMLQLTAAQRAAIRREADAGVQWRPARLPMHWIWGLGTAAAALIVLAIVLPDSPRLPSAAERVGGPLGTGIATQDNPAGPASAMPDVAGDQGLASRDGRSPSTPDSRASSSRRPAAAGSAPRTDQRAITGGPEPIGQPAPSGASPSPEQKSATTSAVAPTTAPSAPGTVAGERALADAPRSAGALQHRAAEVVTPAPSAPSPLSRAGRGGVPGGVVGGVIDSFVGAPPIVADRRPLIRPSATNESYARVGENGFVRARQEPLATFSIDVDTASYSNVRRFLTQNQLPPPDAVRIEELINYFTYDYPRVSGDHPIGASLAVAAAPWNPRNRLVRIGIKARDIDPNRRPSSNLVFLIDVSGSMNAPGKLPLVKSGLKLLVDQLGENDVVSMVVYAGASGLVLPPTRGDRKEAIVRALDDLQAGGSTNGGAGIRLAYDEATANFIRGGTNRVILMTDGDFNVGITSQGDLTRLVEDRARSGVFLSVLGFGMGNLKDSTLERLADQGNGHYGYIDSLSEARKVLVEQMSGTLVTVAKDVKIQVDFNPAQVEAYRLIGYENRVLRPEDFNNDLKDAGDMGAGHTVTALFEVVPRGGSVPGPSIDPSVFQPAPRDTPPPASTSRDMLVLRVRYKLPDASTSTRMDVPLVDGGQTFAAADADFRFAASVAAFGMILKDSPYRGDATLSWVLDAATGSRGPDRGGYRDEFLSLVQKAITLQRRPPAIQ